MKTKSHIAFFSALIFAMWSAPMNAEFTVAKVFGDNMILQRDSPIHIWGWGTPDEVLSISFNGAEKSITINKEGTWEAYLPSFSAGGPHTLNIEGSNTVQFENILMGDVWLCSGQSNMQWNLHQTQYKEEDLDFLEKNMVRMFTVQISWDCLPNEDLAGGQWSNLSSDNIQFFSAVAYHFGKALNQELDVPIGLVNSSLGATNIEAWMSNEALMEFDQFKPDIAPVLEHQLNHASMLTEFESIRGGWERDHYLKGPGIKNNWHLPDTDRSDWSDIEVPAYWDGYGLAEHDGAVWYSKEFDLPEGFSAEQFTLQLNQIRDYDITWVNGVKVGETYGRHTHRNYTFNADILKPTGNVIVVRAFDIGGYGGFTTSAFWGNPILVGTWKFKKGLSIDAARFPKVTMPNVSPFSSPGVLYNANIAPLRDLAISGAIWYQGEANEYRAHEYQELLPAMINDWRAQWNGVEFPFLIVQLANHRQLSMVPAESNWAELREAQYKATSLPNTRIACAIDIGEANDIHPKNKEAVGKRLALLAEDIAYGKDIVSSGPTTLGVNYLENEIQIFFDNIGDGLVLRKAESLLGGFAIAGEDQKFVWADAYIKGKNTVVIPHPPGMDPVAVRYAWADNPVQANLYNSVGLPALPFRTDDWQGSTYGVKYNYENDRF